MFRDNYKKAIDNIKPHSSVKESILKKLEAEEEKQEKKNPATIWRIGTAVALAAAIALTVIFIPKNSVKVKAESLTAANSYNEIYKIFEAQKKGFFSNLWDKYGYVTDGDIVYEEYYATTDDEDMIEGSVGTNTQASGNGSLKGSKPSEPAESTTDSVTDGGDYSETTEQVEGVSEADIMKTDGKYIYYVYNNVVTIVSAKGAESEVLSRIAITGEIDVNCDEMFIKGDRLIILKTDLYEGTKNTSSVIIYDISDRKAPKKIGESCQQGYYQTSRMVGDYIYLISNCPINIQNIVKSDPTTFVPTVEQNGKKGALPAECIYRYDDEIKTNTYTVIAAYNYKDAALKGSASILGGTDQVYCSKGNIILANTRYNNKKSDSDDTYVDSYITVSRLAFSGGEIEYKSTGSVDGTLENQFFIDEYKGYFRFVTTVTEEKRTTQKFDNSENTFITVSNDTTARLTILDGDMKKISEIKNLAKGERVYSVRFMADIAYFVTFRQTDPLFSADLSDPENPKILGELKIPGFSEYMYPYSDGKLLGFGMEADENTGRTSFLKLSMFNIKDPANVTEEDKTVIGGYYHSSALNNHKAMMVAVDKNLMGFIANNYNTAPKYMIYKYEGDRFVKLAEIDMDTDYEYTVRGAFVGDNFYIVSNEEMKILSITDFSLLKTIDF